MLSVMREAHHMFQEGQSVAVTTAPTNPVRCRSVVVDLLLLMNVCGLMV